MQSTTECISSFNSASCNNRRLKCKEGFTGQLCNKQIQEYQFYTNTDVPMILIPANTIQYLKLSPQEQYDKLIVATIAVGGHKTRSIIWETVSPENYNIALANNNSQIPSLNMPLLGAAMPPYTMDVSIPFPVVDAKKEHYFMIINNFADDSMFIAYAVNAPHDDPICLCTNDKS